MSSGGEEGDAAHCLLAAKNELRPLLCPGWASNGRENTAGGVSVSAIFQQFAIFPRPVCLRLEILSTEIGKDVR